jgi:ABC-type multidrug transport system permease subunit
MTSSEIEPATFRLVALILQQQIVYEFSSYISLYTNRTAKDNLYFTSVTILSYALRNPPALSRLIQMFSILGIRLRGFEFSLLKALQ